MKTRDRILAFLEAHQDKHYTAKQIAHYLKLTERTVLKHAEALIRSGSIHDTYY